MGVCKIELTEDELDLVLDTLSFQFKYNYSDKIESLMIKMDEKREEDKPTADTSFELYKTMVASTCHVTQEDFKALEYFPEIFTTQDHHYGTRIYLGEDLLHEVCKVSISEGLRVLILFAVSHDCRYLEIDSDGPEYEGFPRYEW